MLQQQYDDARRLQEEENILRRASEIQAARQAGTPEVLSNQRIQELKEEDFRRQRVQQVPTSLAPPPPVAPGGPAGLGEDDSAGHGNQVAAPPPAATEHVAQEEDEEEDDAWDEWQWWHQGHHQGGQSTRVPAWHQEYIDAGWIQDAGNPHIWWKQHWDGHWQRWKQPVQEKNRSGWACKMAVICHRWQTNQVDSLNRDLRRICEHPGMAAPMRDLRKMIGNVERLLADKPLQASVKLCGEGAAALPGPGAARPGDAAARRSRRIASAAVAADTAASGLRFAGDGNPFVLLQRMQEEQNRRQLRERPEEQQRQQDETNAAEDAKDPAGRGGSWLDDMAMTWTAKDFVGELEACEKLLAARNTEQMQDALLAQLQSKLNNIGQVGPSEMVLCYEALERASLPDGMTDKLQETLDVIAAGAHQSNGATNLAAVAQTCATFEHYLTEKDAAALGSCSMWEGCRHIAFRLRMIGVKGMKESLKKRCTAILVWFHVHHQGNPVPAARVGYDLSLRLMTELKQSNTAIPPGAPSLARYPPDPLRLPASHLQASYPDGLPAKKDLNGLATLMQHHIFVRSNGKLLQESLQPKVNVVLPAAPAQPLAAPDSDTKLVSSLMAFLKNANTIQSQTQPSVQFLTQPTAASSRSQGAAQAPCEQTKASLPLQNGSLAPGADTASLPLQNSAEPAKTLEQFEAEHLAMLEARDKKAASTKQVGQDKQGDCGSKPASKAAAKSRAAKPGPKAGKPKAKGKVLKRPAAKAFELQPRADNQGLRLTRSEWLQRQQLYGKEFKTPLENAVLQCWCLSCKCGAKLPCMAEPSKKRKILDVRQEAPFCSQTALAAICQNIAEHGLPEKHSRRDIWKETEELLHNPSMEKYGPLFQTAEAETVKGPKQKLLFVNFLSLLAGVFHAAGPFARWLLDLHAKHPSSYDSCWDAVIYADEMHPGNQLSSSSRKSWCVYISFLQFKSLLSREDFWYCLCVKRTEEVSELKAGMSQVMRLILESLFGTRLPETGVLLASAVGTLRLHFRLGMILQDGAAHKAVFSNRQDTGCKPCPLCSNIFQLKDTGNSGRNVWGQFLKRSDCIVASDEEIMACWERLAEAKGSQPAGHFEQRQKAAGMTWSQHALLSSSSLQQLGLCRPSSLYCYDYMRCLVSHGVMNEMAFWVLEDLTQSGLLSKDWSRLQQWLGLWNLPNGHANFKLDGLFSSKAVASYRKAGSVKVGASEMLTLCKPLQFFLQSNFLSHGLQEATCRAFVAWADVLDYAHSIQGLQNPSPPRFLHLVEAALQATVEADFSDHLRPKHHWPLHLPDCLQRWQQLPSCWALERKHKVPRKYGSNQFGLEAYNKAVMTGVTQEHVGKLLKDEELFVHSSHIISKTALGKPLESFLRANDWLLPGMEASGTCRLENGMLCKSGDILFYRCGSKQQHSRLSLGLWFFEALHQCCRHGVGCGAKLPLRQGKAWHSCQCLAKQS
ncbi:unnamed protein product [Symbiodinium sp. CCMP2592]|nr:unnamed protein product [Symbiodinium sp. CCMP2592]